MRLSLDSSSSFSTGSNDPAWLQWARELQALAQSGLHFSPDVYDRERYERIREMAAGMMAYLSGGEDPEPILHLFREQAGYATPKVDVRAAAFRNGRILLVQELADNGRWTLPGGWADVNQTPSECVVREVREESGYEVRPLKLLAVFDRSRHGHVPPLPFSIYKMFFLCEIVGGAPAESVETTGAAFFGEKELPELSVSRVTEAQIRRCFEHLRRPELPADFD